MMFLARSLSLLGPPLISILSPFLIVYKSTGDPLYALKWELFSFTYIGTVILFVFYGVAKGFFSDFDISKRQERIRLFMFSFLTSCLYLVSLFLFHAPWPLITATISIMAGIIIASLVNMMMKPSLHVASVSAFIVSLVLWYSMWFLFALVFIPLVAWSRVITKRHTVIETVVGGTIGITLPLIVYFVLKYLI